MRKQAAICALGLFLAIALHSIALAASSFSDVKEDAWYAGYVQSAIENGLVEGYPDGSFKPQKALKYAEFIAMMTLQQTTDEKIARENSTHWGFPYYNKALELGYFEEADIPAARLNDPIPRRHMARIAAGFLQQNAQLPENIPACSYSDIAAGDPDLPCISLCSALGVLEGYNTDNSFRPDNTLKRCEAVKVAVCCTDISKGKELQKPAEQTSAEKAQAKAPYMQIGGTDSEGRVLVTGIGGLIPEERGNFMDKILSTVQIVREGQTFFFCYEQPEIPAPLQPLISCIVYCHELVIDPAGGKKGEPAEEIVTRSIYEYGNEDRSPDSWENERKCKYVKSQILDVGDTMDDETVVIRIELRDPDNAQDGPRTAYEIVREPKGSASPYMRVITSFAGEEYTEKTAVPDSVFKW